MEDEDDTHGKIGDLLRLGLVSSVDLSSGTAEVQCGEITSPACPWVELAGNFRTWRPPTVGEQVLLLCPEGDIAGGIILRGLLSTSFPAPASDENHHLIGADGLTIKLTSEGIVIEAPGDVEITGDVKITGNLSVDGDADITGTATADQDVVGGGISLKSHKHTGVQPGSGMTGAPQ